MNVTWTQQQTDELRRLYTTTTAPELARHLGTSVSAVYQKAFSLGLRKDQPGKIKLSQEQESWLRRNYRETRNEICTVYLGISMSSLARLARRYGLAKSPQFMRDCRLYTAKKTKESHLKNGTYPPKGFAIPNREKYYFKPKQKTSRHELH